MKLNKALEHLIELSELIKVNLNSEDTRLYRKAQSLKTKFNHQSEILRIMHGESVKTEAHGVNARYKDNLAWACKTKRLLDNRKKEYIREYIN